MITKTQITFWLKAWLVVSLLAISSGTSAQVTSSPTDLLPPPKANLVALHWPDLTSLEPAVREQLGSLQKALVSAASNRKITDEALSEAYGTLGQNYQAYSLNVAARSCYVNAGRLKPQDFRWIYLLARMDQQEDRLDEAIRGYLAARQLRPEYVAVPVNLGNIYLQANRLDEATENFKAALAISGGNAAALYGMGQVALSQRRYADAVEYFESALRAAPDANRIHYSLAMAYRNLSESEKAMAHLRQQGTVGVRVKDPLFDGLEELIIGERVHLVRGKLALDSRRYQEAIDEFRQALTANHDSLSAHVNLGFAMVQTGDRKGAIVHFEEAVRIDPHNSNARFNLAVLLAQEDKHAEAIRHLQSIVGDEPKDVSARFFLAQELVRSDRLDEALKEFSRVAEADPTNEDALLNQVTLLEQKGQTKTAMEALQKAHAQDPQKERTAATLAYLLASSPELDLRDGVRSLEIAQTLFKVRGSAEHGALVAMALAELGRCDEAAEWQRRMIAAAEQEQKPVLLDHLKADLKLYERGRPCRPGKNSGAEDLKD